MDFLIAKHSLDVELFSEIQKGIAVSDENGNVLGESSNAAKWGITQVASLI